MRDNLRFLIVEDDPAFRETVRSVLGVYNEIQEAGDLKCARSALQNTAFDVVVIDKSLPDGSGLELIPEIKGETPNTVVVILTADDNYREVQKCLAAGAADYIVKSKNVMSDLLIRIPMAVSRVAIERRSTDLEGQLRESLKFEIMGGSAYLRELRSTIKSLKWSRSSVLITGESGTGKELVARRIYAIEEDRNRPFVVVNCGAIPANLFESELFGHKKGAFTGANTDKIGKIELANGGDLFLDEIGELPLALQPALLRVLQDGCFMRVGSNKTIHSSFRVIAATNRPLEDRVAAGQFREDLYYRLNVVRINTPSLRNCLNDIPDLARFFLLQLGGSRLTIAEEALACLKNHDWPGNFRELRNCVERAKMAAEARASSSIDPDDFTIMPVPKRRGRQYSVGMPTCRAEISSEALARLIDEVEHEYLRGALELCDGKATELAPLLSQSRATTFRKMNYHGLTRRTRNESDEVSAHG